MVVVGLRWVGCVVCCLVWLAACVLVVVFGVSWCLVGCFCWGVCVWVGLVGGILCVLGVCRLGVLGELYVVWVCCAVVCGGGVWFFCCLFAGVVGVICFWCFVGLGYVLLSGVCDVGFVFRRILIGVILVFDFGLWFVCG